MNTPEQSFGLALKALRGAWGCSQRELAQWMAATGHPMWAQATVSQTEAGARPLRLNEFVSICAILHQDPIEVLKPLVSGSAATDTREAELRIALVRAEIAAVSTAAKAVEAATALSAARQALADGASE